MSAIEITAHDVETAIKTGLAQVNLLRAEVKIEVLDDGNRGVLGIGARPARVRLTPYAEIEAAEAAVTRAATAPTPESQGAGSSQPAKTEPAVQQEPQVAPEPIAPPKAEAVVSQTAPATEQEAEPAPLVSTEHEQLAATLTQGVLDRMDLQVTCTSRTIAPHGDESSSIWVDIQGRDASRLLAHQSEALDALQLVVQTMWAHQTKSNLRLTIDADSYKERREKRIQQMAQRLAERVVSSGRSITLEPMPPSERRLVHIALRDHAQVTTESHGEGSGRRITIKLK